MFTYRSELIKSASAYESDLTSKIEKLEIERENVRQLKELYQFASLDSQIRELDNVIASKNKKNKRKSDKKLKTEISDLKKAECHNFVNNDRVFQKLRTSYRKISNKINRTEKVNDIKSENEKKCALDEECGRSYFDLHQPKSTFPISQKTANSSITSNQTDNRKFPDNVLDDDQIEKLINKLQSSYPSVKLTRISENNELMTSLLLQKNIYRFVAICLFTQLSKESKNIILDGNNDVDLQNYLILKLTKTMQRYAKIAKLNNIDKMSSDNLQYIENKLEPQLYTIFGNMV